MKTKKNVSPYSKMFLVGPAVYSKLLNCLDAVDKKTTEDLNRTDVEESNISRPSERELQILQEEEINNNSEEQQQEIISPNEVEQQPDEDNLNANLQQGDENAEEITPNDDEIQIERNEPVPNILRSPCPDKTTDMRGEIPKRIIPCGKNKPVLIIPEVKKRTKTHKCEICQKTFTQGWNLRHHRNTVHKVKENIEGDQLTCTICNDKFDDFNMLDSHYKEKHSNLDSGENNLNLSESDLNRLNDSNDIVMKRQGKLIKRNDDEFMTWSTRFPRKVKRKTISYKPNPRAEKLKITNTDAFENPAKKPFGFNKWP